MPYNPGGALRQPGLVLPKEDRLTGTGIRWSVASAVVLKANSEGPIGIGERMPERGNLIYTKRISTSRGTNMNKGKQQTGTQAGTKPEEYDLLILGSGGAGKLLSWTLARRGMKTAVVERKYVGGSCPNIACLPSKNIIHSAEVASYFRRSEEFGITKENWKINMGAVRERKRRMVAGLVDLHLDNYKKSGAELVMGSGRFTGPRTIEVRSADGAIRVLRGNRVVINIGTHATIEATPGLREAGPLTHIEALELDRVPEHLFVLGGGYVGLEFAQAMRRFGSRVTIVERNPRLIHREDEDISAAMLELFRDEGIDVLTNTRITRVEGKSGALVRLNADHGGSATVLEGSHLLVAAGRTPNTDGIGLDLAGVETTSNGYIKVNERLETTAPNVWAAGECAGSPHFTHISENDFHVISDNIQGGHRVTTGRQVPFCLFTDPEFARIGFSEREAKERGISYRLATIPLNAVLRARTLTDTRGFMKALIDSTSERILGFSAFGAEAGEVMATVQVAMIAGLPFTALRDAIFTHPTMAEGLISLFSNVSATTAPVREERGVKA
jgi:pyruvate/2-oxoglutarate dehydrogenase complex dihydrolipoamide dehydrogenase (E3) component